MGFLYNAKWLSLISNYGNIYIGTNRRPNVRHK